MRILGLGLTLGLVLCLGISAPSWAADDLARQKAQAAKVSIIRDDWGIAHIHGPTDADAVFGLVYAQAEDDFNRVETNFINAQGRMAEVQGESAIWQDLRMKLFIDPVDLKADYAASPTWLKALMKAWADGLNYYLATHPAVKPRLITHFEPWMALSFSEGSIGGDIESVSLTELERFYGQHPVSLAEVDLPGQFHEPAGSNGFAIAPSITATGRAMLLINPHTSFFFRSEVQVSSDQGLNAYGAVTWGQFFVYQGFNEKAGWMHTSSGADVIDEFAETVSEKDHRLVYRYGHQDRPVQTSIITVPYRAADGSMTSRAFTVYRTHHGPIVRQANGKWISVSLMNTPLAALKQSFLRTKATDYASFVKVAQLKANSSNNTIFADSKGQIAYLHPQFIPRRNDKFDYTKPVDGSDPATDWQGVHGLNETPRLLNPSNGWLFNTNNWPYSAAGDQSPRLKDFPRYMDTYGENPRGIHAMQVLSARKDFTLQTLIDAAYDPYMPAFASLIPSLAASYDRLAANDPLKARLADQIAVLRSWDMRWSVQSVPTSVAVFWGEALWNAVGADADSEDMSVYDYMATKATDAQKLMALAQASDRLARDFGNWRTPWGEINRFQRLTGDIVHPFTDGGPSIPVAFTSAQWGSLASFGAKPRNGSKRYYGTNGNSFVAVVEFGNRVRARAVAAGGESGDPASPHFNDQALRYSTGDLREVYFYPDQLVGHTERTYHPGQ